MEIKSRYAYVLTIYDDKGSLVAYDYFVTRKIILNNSALFNKLSGIDLCYYKLEDKENYRDFFDTLNVICKNNARRIYILFDLDKSAKEFLQL